MRRFPNSRKQFARKSAGNEGFAVLPQAKKRKRNAVLRVGSYTKPGPEGVYDAAAGLEALK